MEVRTGAMVTQAGDGFVVGGTRGTADEARLVPGLTALGTRATFRVQHDLCTFVQEGAMSSSTRFNVQLDEVRATKLRALAERTHVNPGTLARSLLSTALDEADPDPDSVVALLDSIPGAFDRAQEGLREIRAGKEISLDEL